MNPTENRFSNFGGGWWGSEFGGYVGEKQLYSGKKKAHKHNSFWPVTVRWGGESPGRVSIYVLSKEPKKHNFFCPGTRPGRAATGVTGQSFVCQSLKCFFLLPIFVKVERA